MNDNERALFRTNAATAMKSWHKHRVNWYPVMQACLVYYRDPQLFLQIWRDDGHNLQLPPPGAIKDFVAWVDQQLPAFRTARYFTELCPHTKSDLRIMFDAFPSDMVEEKTQGLLILEHLQAAAPSMSSRSGWAKLHQTELVTAIDRAYTDTVIPYLHTITPTFRRNADGELESFGLPPTYTPFDHDIQYGVAVLGTAAHLAKQQGTGCMQVKSCQEVNLLVSGAITAAANNQETSAAVNNSWRFRLTKFLPLALEYLVNKRRVPASITAAKRQRPTEDEDEEAGGAGAVGYDEMREVVRQNTQLRQQVADQDAEIRRLQQEAEAKDAEIRGLRQQIGQPRRPAAS
jgi:hypothetical protein